MTLKDGDTQEDELDISAELTIGLDLPLWLPDDSSETLAVLSKIVCLDHRGTAYRR